MGACRGDQNPGRRVSIQHPRGITNIHEKDLAEVLHLRKISRIYCVSLITPEPLKTTAVDLRRAHNLHDEIFTEPSNLPVEYVRKFEA